MFCDQKFSNKQLLQNINTHTYPVIVPFARSFVRKSILSSLWAATFHLFSARTPQRIWYWQAKLCHTNTHTHSMFTTTPTLSISITHVGDGLSLSLSLICTCDANTGQGEEAFWVMISWQHCVTAAEEDTWMDGVFQKLARRRRRIRKPHQRGNCEHIHKLVC